MTDAIFIFQNIFNSQLVEYTEAKPANTQGQQLSESVNCPNPGNWMRDLSAHSSHWYQPEKSSLVIYTSIMSPVTPSPIIHFYSA